MRPLTILCTLPTLSAVLAVSFSQPSNSTTSNSTSASNSTTPLINPASLPPPPLSAPDACPAQKSKQCCASLSEVGDGLLKPLGMLVPLAGGIELNSLLGLSCKAMADKSPETDCGDAVMCCDSSAVGADNIMQTSCEDFEIAKKHEREAIERQAKRYSAYQAMMMPQSASTSPSPTPTPSVSRARAVAMATPTKV